MRRTDKSVLWRRRDVPQAGISILQNPDWASFDYIQADRGIVYQHFGTANGMVFVSYGPDATPDWQLAHTGIESMTTRRIETDETIELLGVSARRVRMCLHHARTGGHRRGPTGPEALPAAEHEIVVFIGFTLGGRPILVGYRLPASEQAEFEPLLEHVLRAVRPL